MLDGSKKFKLKEVELKEVELKEVEILLIYKILITCGMLYFVVRGIYKASLHDFSFDVFYFYTSFPILVYLFIYLIIFRLKFIFSEEGYSSELKFNFIIFKYTLRKVHPWKGVKLFLKRGFWCYTLAGYQLKDKNNGLFIINSYLFNFNEKHRKFICSKLTDEQIHKSAKKVCKRPFFMKY